MDKVFEVDVDFKDRGNGCGSWGGGNYGYRNWLKRDTDFFWDADERGTQETLTDINGVERNVIRNKFVARLNNNRLRGKGGRKITTDAWFNLTVYFYIDQVGSTFELAGELFLLEPFTLKYIIEAENWPWNYDTDFLAVQITVSVFDIVCDLILCPCL